MNFITDSFLLQIGEQLASNKLPQQLLIFLREPRILKTGRMVNGDLRHLETVSGQGPFQGGLELGALAKQRFLIPDARISLSDLTAALLQHCLPKNNAERIATNWGDHELSAAQIQYAASDAYASLMLFEKINAVPIPESVTASTPTQTLVIILSDDNKKVIARGILGAIPSSQYLGNIHITSTRAVIHVHEVVIPGAKLKIHKNQALSDFGDTPFDIICSRSHLRVDNLSADAHFKSPQYTSHSINVSSTGGELTVSGLVPFEDRGDDEEDSLEPGLIESAFLHEGLNASSTEIENAQPDSESAQIGEKFLGARTLEPSKFVIRSRVLKDPFHVFNMIYISRTHALRIPFAQALRDAMFIPHPEDRRRMIDWLHVKSLTWDFMVQYKAKWVWKHVRRTIPPPEVLYPAIHDVLSKYGPLKDAKTSLPLFSSSTWKTVKNILELARNGYLSDPPGQSLYYCVGLNYRAGGLRIWRCIRGTNMTEGGVHTHLRPRMPTRGTSIRHMRACLYDFVLYHNLHVCVIQ